MRKSVNVNSNFSTRVDEQTGKLYISGYFAVFGSIYNIFPGGTEEVGPNAFDNTINDDIRCLADHDTRIVLGRTAAGTLKLKIDEKGLWGEVEINPKDTEALNLYERVKRGDVNQCSFGFDIVAEDEQWKNNEIHWVLKEVKLYEVSIVTFPAYEDTEVVARKKQLKEINKRENQKFKSEQLKKLKGEKDA